LLTDPRRACYRATTDAQRDIHDGDHARSPTLLWRLTYSRLRLLQDARRMKQKVLGLSTLFGLDETWADIPQNLRASQHQRVANPEALKVAAQLVYDAVTRRNIYHKLTPDGRAKYLMLHR